MQVQTAAEATAIVPSNRSRKVLISHDTLIYKTRNRIERCFNKLEHFAASPISSLLSILPAP
jgi:hypothetical protein